MPSDLGCLAFFLIEPLCERVKISDEVSNPPLTLVTRRVKRHLISTSNHLHGRPAETRPALVICLLNWGNASPKLYSKVLAIEPNRLVKKCWGTLLLDLKNMT
jgi:hypothetical protein